MATETECGGASQKALHEISKQLIRYGLSPDQTIHILDLIQAWYLVNLDETFTDSGKRIPDA